MSEETRDGRGPARRAGGEPVPGARPGRRPYVTPRLTRHGSMVDRTKVFDGDDTSGLPVA